jgi:hypothetical protein
MAASQSWAECKGFLFVGERGSSQMRRNILNPFCDLATHKRPLVIAGTAVGNNVKKIQLPGHLGIPHKPNLQTDTGTKSAEEKIR